jgi:hypothetical protein
MKEKALIKRLLDNGIHKELSISLSSESDEYIRLDDGLIKHYQFHELMAVYPLSHFYFEIIVTEN